MIAVCKKSLLVFLLAVSALRCASPYYGRHYYDRSAYGSGYGSSHYGNAGRGGYRPYTSFPYGGYYGGNNNGYHHHHDADHDGD